MPATTSQPASDKLLAEFPSVSYEAWRQLVEKELKGAPFEKKMVSVTAEGIALQPIYCRADVENLPHVNSLPGFAPFVRGAEADGYLKEPWKVSQEIEGPSPAGFNHTLSQAVSRGLDAVNMGLDRATCNGLDPDLAPAQDVGFGGLSVATSEDLARALDGVDLGKISLFIRAGAASLPIAALLLTLARKRGMADDQVRGCLETDPLSVLAYEGTLPQSLGGAYREMAALTDWAVKNAPQLQTVGVHSCPWHESGGHAVQELAYTLATAVEYLRQLDKLGLTVQTAAPRFRFTVTVGSHFFMEIAKLRALRMLWASAVAAAGGDEEAQKISLHVRTSHWNKTVVDPYNNLLRTTVEAFAGVLGGCDSMQVGAFDEVLRTPDEFSQRIARNTQLVLQKECALDHVIDPVGGSWFVENATNELATRSWALFQEIEKLGGMEAALRAGVPQKALAASASVRIKAVTGRRNSIVGVTQYANPKEAPLTAPAKEAGFFHNNRVQDVASHRVAREATERQAVAVLLTTVEKASGPALLDACIAAASAGATLGELTRALRPNDSSGEQITPVRCTRAAATVEALRSAMNRHPSGTAPVFLCNMGPLKEHKARADFASGFFGVGGYDVLSPAGFATPEAALEAFAASGAEVAVICSTDDRYPDLVPPLVAGIRSQKPAASVVLAGYPTDQIETYKKLGVDEFIHLRADVLEVLSRIHSKLGIS